VQALHPTVVLDIGNHEIATEQILDDKGPSFRTDLATVVRAPAPDSRL
jgi:hypothetical protein